MKAFEFFAFPLALLTCFASWAAGNDGYSTRQLVEMAVSRNPELRALSLEAESAKHSADQASRWNNPSLELGGARKEERDGDTNFTKVGVSQLIERPGRTRSRTQAAKARAETSVINRNFSELELRALVLKLVYAYKVANEKANHAKERLDRFKTVGTYLRSRVFASPQKGAEAAIVRTKLMVLGRELRELEANRKTAWLHLNLYLGLDSEPKIKVDWYESAPAVQLETMIAELKNKNPNLQKQNQRIVEIENELNLARSDAWPGLTLSGSFENGTGTNPEKVYGLGVSIPIPVFDAKGSAIRGRQSLYDAEKERREWTQASAIQELSSAVEHYNSAKVSLAELGISEISKLEKDMVAIDRGFKKGQVDLLTYIEADAEHFESLNAILDSQIDFIDAQNSLYLLIGQSPRILE